MMSIDGAGGGPGPEIELETSSGELGQLGCDSCSARGTAEFLDRYLYTRCVYWASRGIPSRARDRGPISPIRKNHAWSLTPRSAPACQIKNRVSGSLNHGGHSLGGGRKISAGQCTELSACFPSQGL